MGGREIAKKRLCNSCRDARAVLRRPKTMDSLCRECFYEAFETEVHETIMKYNLFRAGEKVVWLRAEGKTLQFWPML